MKCYIKDKELEVEQFFDNMKCLNRISDLVECEIVVNYHDPRRPTLRIKGRIVHIGDFIIKDENKISICSARIFKDKYRLEKEV